MKTINCQQPESTNLTWGKVLICTAILSHIDEVKGIKIGNLIYMIKVEEEESSLMGLLDREMDEDQSENSDEEVDVVSLPSSNWPDVGGRSEDEDGVEDTWQEGGADGHREISSTGGNVVAGNVAGNTTADHSLGEAKSGNEEDTSFNKK